jgi:hypothetical protein
MVSSFRSQVMQLNKVIRLILLSALLLLPQSYTVFAAELVPFTAKFTAFKYGKELGSATLKLDDLGRNKFKLSFRTKAAIFFFTDKRYETSLFSFKDDVITPYRYTYEHDGALKDNSFRAEFNSETKSILVDGETQLPWQGELDNQIYRLDLQRKLANGETEFEYTLINNRGQIRKYKIIVIGKEQLDLPYGMLEGIKVKIVRESKKRETFAWFSPELGYQLVRFQQFKDGEEQGDIQLSKYTADRKFD